MHKCWCLCFYRYQELVPALVLLLVLAHWNWSVSYCPIHFQAKGIDHWNWSLICCQAVELINKLCSDKEFQGHISPLPLSSWCCCCCCCCCCCSVASHSPILSLAHKFATPPRFNQNSTGNAAFNNNKLIEGKNLSKVPFSFYYFTILRIWIISTIWLYHVIRIILTYTYTWWSSCRLEPVKY